MRTNKQMNQPDLRPAIGNLKPISPSMLHPNNSVLRHCDDAAMFARKSIPSDWIDYVPTYTCLYLSDNFQVSQFAIESVFEFHLSRKCIRNIVKKTIAIDCYGVIVAINSINVKSPQEETCFFAEEVSKLSSALKRSDDKLLDAFLFTSTEVRNIIRSKIPYYALKYLDKVHLKYCELSEEFLEGLRSKPY